MNKKIACESRKSKIQCDFRRIWENPKYRIFSLGKYFQKVLTAYICTYTLAQPKNFGWEAGIMVDKDKFADEVMSDEELDQVAGGTVAEFDEICSAMANNPFVKNALRHMSEGFFV